MASSSRIFQTSGGRQLDETDYTVKSRPIPDENENRQFRPIFHPIITEQMNSGNQQPQKWPDSNKQPNLV